MKKKTILALGILAVISTAVTLALINNGCKDDDDLPIPDDDYEPNDEDCWDAVEEGEQERNTDDVSDNQEDEAKKDETV